MTFFASEEKNILRHSISSIKNLLKERQNQEALHAAEELLLAFPDNVEVFTLREKAISSWKSERLEVVKKTIKKAVPLWKSKNYEELQKIYENLDQYLPDCPLLQAEFLRLNRAIEAAEKLAREEYVQKGLSLAHFHEKKDDFLEALKVLKKVSEVDPANAAIFRAVFRNKRKYVDHNLKHIVAELLRHGEYEEALHLATNLLKVMPEYTKLHGMIQKCERLIMKKRLEEKNAYIKASLMQIRQFFREKKYEQCMDACYELLSLSPSNLRVKYWMMRATFADRRMETDDLYGQMTNSWNRMSDAMSASVGKHGPVEGMKGWRRI